MAGNFPKFCGLVKVYRMYSRYSTSGYSGNRLLASIRTVTLYFSRYDQVFVIEYCGHQTHPARAIPLPAFPCVNEAG